jgi:RAB protein geranylgeranyltransferase component A
MRISLEESLCLHSPGTQSADFVSLLVDEKQQRISRVCCWKMDDLPGEFDLVVVGTGFSESVIAAAASRVGKAVLHVDENENYGGFWSSFNFDTFLSHLENSRNDENMRCRLRNCKERWFEFTEEQPEVNGWDKEKIMKEKRRFNVDLIPKVKTRMFPNVPLIQKLFPIIDELLQWKTSRAADFIEHLPLHRVPSG